MQATFHARLLLVLASAAAVSGCVMSTSAGGPTYAVLFVRGLIWAEDANGEMRPIGPFYHCDYAYYDDPVPEQETIYWSGPRAPVTDATRVLVVFEGNLPFRDNDMCRPGQWLVSLPENATEITDPTFPDGFGVSVVLDGDEILLDGEALLPGESRTIVVDEPFGDLRLRGYVFIDHHGEWGRDDVVHGSSPHGIACTQLAFKAYPSWYHGRPGEIDVGVEFSGGSGGNAIVAGFDDGARFSLELRDPATRALIATTLPDPQHAPDGGPATLGERREEGWGYLEEVVSATFVLTLEGQLEAGETYEVIAHYSTIGSDAPGCSIHELYRTSMETWAPG